jgi:hypothetical protein
MVKCQRSSSAVPIVGKLDRPHNDRVVILQKRIKWLETHYRYFANTNAKNDILNTLRQELAELLAEDAKADKLRSLPLYYHKRISKFVCSKCYDRLSLRVR